MREIVEGLVGARREGRACAHCLVVDTRGSTPQKPGAAMLVFPDGGQVGTLGGGCTEAEVRREALKRMAATEAALLTYTLDDDYGWDDGLICGGRMTFCIQPIPAWDAFQYFERLAELMAGGSGGTEAVVLDAQGSLPAGARFLFDRQGRLVVSLASADCPDAIRDSVENLSARPQPRSAAGVAYLPFLPRCRLLLVGGGHVAQAVAALAHQVDFEVWVLDDRPAYACPERFPHAQRLLVGDIGQTLKEFQPDENAYCLIVTRGHAHDEEALFHLAPKPARYVGLIGSKRKIRMIFEDLEEAGIPAEALDRVHAPLGIDIGSRTVPEIAVSIVAQLIGHRNRGPEAFPPQRWLSGHPRTRNTADGHTPSEVCGAGS